MTIRTRIVIRVAFDADLCCGGNYIGSLLGWDGVAIRAVQLCLWRAMAFVLEGGEPRRSFDLRLSSTLWLWTDSSLLPSLRFYHYG